MADARLLGLPRDESVALTRLALDAGVSHFSVADHVSFHTGLGFDGLLLASMMATLDDRLEVVVGVYLLALRHPVLVARQLASLAEVAPGRVMLGVGVGGEDPHEFEICGVDPRQRGRRTDDVLKALALLLDGEAVSYQCEFFSFEEALILPVPDPKIPIVIGGRSQAALKRAGMLGDGWLGIWSTPERFGARLRQVEDFAEAAGRESVAWNHGYQPWVCVDDNETRAREKLAKRMQAVYRIPFERFERYAPYGSPARVADALVAFGEQGCHYLNVMNVAESPQASIEGMARLCEAMHQPQTHVTGGRT